MKEKNIRINIEEKVALQTMIALQIRKNKEYEGTEVEPCFSTKDLKKLYEKIAGYEYEER